MKSGLSYPVAISLAFLSPLAADSACCYFSAKDRDINQPAQKVFITWDPQQKVESFTVQPRFEGNALDFGMVIPTPSQPKLDEMPRDFFKDLAVFTILKKREQLRSRLLVEEAAPGGDWFFDPGAAHKSTVKVLEAGIVGVLDYKIVSTERADDLYAWLADNKYHYAGDEATLAFYVNKKWFFTVMKIDTRQMKKDPDGAFSGDISPTRFRFASEQLVYPLKITQISVKNTTEALFYVQAPYKVDLPGDLTYQYQWVPLLENAQSWSGKGVFGSRELPGKADDWLKAIDKDKDGLLTRGMIQGFNFIAGRQPQANKQGRTPTTLEWAKRLTADDIKVLKGEAGFSDKLPDLDAGFTEADLKDEKRRDAIHAVIRERQAKYRKERPAGYLVRAAPAEDVRKLKELLGHLQEGQFVTKFRKVFTKAEMNEDLLILPARVGDAEDRSEYEELLPSSPP